MTLCRFSKGHSQGNSVEDWNGMADFIKEKLAKIG